MRRTARSAWGYPSSLAPEPSRQASWGIASLEGRSFSDQPISILHGDPPKRGYYIKLEVDKTTYARGEVAHFTLQGLAECAGETIRFGFFSSGDPDAAALLFFATGDVNSDGSGAVGVPVERAGLTVYPGLEGDCLQWPNFVTGPSI